MAEAGVERERPDLARAIESHCSAVMEAGRVPQSTKELCATIVCALNFAQDSMLQRRRIARRLGISAQTLSELFDYARSELFTGAEKAALGAAVALTREPRALPEAVRAELREHYDEGQLVEILCAIGLFNYLNRVTNAIGPYTP